MGKMIPTEVPSPIAQEAPHTQPAPAAPIGPLLREAQGLELALKQTEEVLDLDELDRLARRHARAPASGAADALESLAVVVRCAPDLFHRTEVNLEPRRLETLADRGRALDLLCGIVHRFHDLAKDSQMEQGDEVVELLTVGYQRARNLDSARLLSNDGLAQAMATLRGYQERIVSENAHRSAAQGEDVKKTKKKP